jgi:hypothetical protein
MAAEAADMTSTDPSPYDPHPPSVRQGRLRRRPRPRVHWVAPKPREIGSTPAVRQRVPARSGRWLLLILGVVVLVIALGSGIVVPTLLGDPEGYSLLLAAPAAGLIAGIAAGLVAARRRLLAPGFVVAVAGLFLGVLVGSLTLPDGRQAVASGYWLAFILAIAGVPLAVGYGVMALAHSKPGPLDRLAWALKDWMDWPGP